MVYNSSWPRILLSLLLASRGRRNPYQHSGGSVDTLCDSVTCGATKTCRVVKQNENSFPQAVCFALTTATQIFPDIDALCLTNGYRQTVLSGNFFILDELEPLACSECDGLMCPYGSTCVREGESNGVCCLKPLDCRESLSSQFQHTTLVFEGRTYLLSQSVVANDGRANAICNALGGYLAELETEEEYEAIRNFLIVATVTEGAGVYISGTDRVQEGSFIYQNSGRALVYEAFVAPQPNGGVNQNCIHLHASRNFDWDDISCDHGGLLFLCEIPQTSSTAQTCPDNSQE